MSCASERRIAELERRLNALEAAGRCPEGHSFVQADSPFVNVLFCTRCGQVQALGEERRIGLASIQE